MPKNETTQEALKVLANSSLTAQALFQAFSVKARSRARLDLQRFKGIVEEKTGKLNKEDFYKVFESLEKLGIGKIVRSPTGIPRKFAWNYALSSVGAAGLQGEPMRTQFARKQLPKIHSPKPSAPRVLEVDTVLDNGHALHLRGEYSDVVRVLQGLT